MAEPQLPPATRIRRAFDRAATTYDQAAGIQLETLQALVAVLPEHLPVPDATLIDLGCGTGHALPLLGARYPSARLLGIDLSEAMLRTVLAGNVDNLQKTAADAARLPLRNATCDLVFCSLTWQWCNLPEVLAEARRVLKPGGTLAFSTLIDGTFRELAAAFAGIDRHRHTLALLSADQVLAAVRDAGFDPLQSRPVTRTARYPDLSALLHAIRATGASEISGTRRRGLLGKSAWQTIATRYATFAAADGQLPLTYEVLEVITAR